MACAKNFIIFWRQFDQKLKLRGFLEKDWELWIGKKKLVDIIQKQWKNINDMVLKAISFYQAKKFYGGYFLCY